MKIAYLRIIGNDLPPRHVDGQNYANLEFQLENEEKFQDCETAWILNRIVNRERLAALKSLLDSRGCKYYEIDINVGVYAQQRTFDEKFHYLTGVNRARNLCLDLAKDWKVDIALPFDGNCYFTSEGFYYFRNTVANNFNSPYFIVPMSRCKDLGDLDKPPQIKEMYTVGRMKRQDLTEPQIAFGADYDVTFNTAMKYSKASKVELLWKLGIPGIWDYWYPDMHTAAMKNASKYVARNPVYAGYVMRLPSGNPEAETDNIERGRLREEGLRNLVELADSVLLGASPTK